MANLSFVSKGSGKVLLLLHGYGASKESFSAQIECFSQYFKVYAVDLSGFGQNPKLNKPYKLDDYITDLLHFLKSLNIQTFSLIAHSFGARLVLKSDELRSKCDKIVLTGGAGLKPKRNLKYYYKIYKFKLLKRFFPKKNIKGYGSAEYKSLNEIERQSYKNIVNEHLDYKLNSIVNPTLIVNGKIDKVTPKSSAKKLLKGIKNSRLIFIDGGHFAFAQNARVFNAIVKEFLLG